MLDRLLRPRTIAVIGGRPAAEVIRQNDRLGFSGAIWPVHPVHEAVEGRAAYRDVAALPAAPDAVFLAVNRHRTVQTVRALAERGAGGVICYAAGFAETDDAGRALQQALREAAGSMPVLGPNCYGTINYLDGAALWPDQHGGVRVARGVAIVTQSGNIGCNLTMQRRGLPLAYLATLGNQAVIGLPEMIEALAADSRITAIGLHIEGIADAGRFAAAARIAREAGKPLVALKTGASSAGAALTISHTASLAGADAVVDAFLARAGVSRVRTIPELLETLKLLHAHGPLPSTDIVSMSCSGGEAALIADLGERRGVAFRRFTPEQHEAIRATVPPLVTVSNPFDYHTFAWADRAAMAAIFTAVLRARFALAVLILDFPRDDRCDDRDWSAAADALADAAAATGQPAAIVATMAEGLPEARAEQLRKRGLIPLLGLDEALVAIAAAAEQARPLALRMLCALPPAGSPHLLDEWRSKQALASHGVPVPAGIRTREATGAAPAYPAVAKAIGIAHKTEHAAVRLNLHDRAAVTKAVAALMPLGDGVLVEAMVQGAVAELIVGVARDPLGPYLLLGSGGVLAELVGDRVILMLPASAEAIRAALASLKVAALLAGFRGRPAGDTEAAVAAILAIQAAAIARLDTLLELDVNPLMVTPTGAFAADALFSLTEVPHDD